MPRPWSEKEKEIIKKTLLVEARRLFEKYGLQKTTVDEIARTANISKGSFYIFYQSKEELYFDVLEDVEREFKDKMFKNAFEPGMNRRKSFKSFLNQMIDLLITMPLYKEITSSNYELLLRKLPEKTLEEHMQRDQEEVSKFFNYWMDQGWMKKVDIEALNGLFLSLIHFVIHRDDFKGSNFEAAKDLWIDALANYLIIEDDKAEEKKVK
ncbi:MAG: TetR/AcrR family transcriptional regulator [Methanobacterium sp.]|jgi:AcrR family transcriptional regulator|uniref:TetR/AcrR family transcriptional regulator n=1 Tax=Methanobacterium sp. TaxID=2164 RepID=UPI0025878FB1|nr:TetR/AcrR family transcriptional regulator [Methanobacterium sp.]MCC7559667.1 TetR/AcrR family transcriptional regulator [Methanobacterium sp.]